MKLVYIMGDRRTTLWAATLSLPQTGKTKTAFGIGRGKWRGFMHLQWNRIPKIYKKSVGPMV